MTQSAWKLGPREATATLAGLSLRVDTWNPMSGVEVVTLAHPEQSPLRLFEIAGLACSGDDDPREDCYIRGSDLVATYKAQGQHHKRTQIYWRLSPAAEQHQRVTLDLTLSVQTDLLDDQARLSVKSDLTRGDCFLLQIGSEGSFRWQVAPLDRVNHLAASQTASCVACRLQARPWTYLEMVHPVDRTEGTLERNDREHWRHEECLFPQPLEKGVILRSRLRGIMLDRADDLLHALACYQEFAASEPPLST